MVFHSPREFSNITAEANEFFDVMTTFGVPTCARASFDWTIRNRMKNEKAREKIPVCGDWKKAVPVSLTVGDEHKDKRIWNL